MRASVLLTLLVLALVAIIAWVAFVPSRAYSACPNAETALPSFKAKGKAEIITGARLDIYVHLALKHLGIDFSEAPRAILERKPGSDLITFEDAGGCLLPIEVKVPTTEFI